MTAIVLAGGLGTRLRGVISDIPKPMAPIAGKPFLEYLLLQIAKWRIKKVVLSVGFKKEMIKAYFGKGGQYGIQIVYAEEKEPLGTGGALKKALSCCDSADAVVMNGDSFFNIDLPELVNFHLHKTALATLGLAHVEDKSRYGSVEVGTDGQITNFAEKRRPGPGFINGGIYLIQRDVADYIPEGQTSLEMNVFPLLKQKQALYGKICPGFFIDIGIPEDYHWLSTHASHLTS